MRPQALAAILFLFLSTALTVSANSVSATGKSSYGGPTTGSLTQDTSMSLGSGFTGALDDSFSNGTDSFLEIDTPGLRLPAGTTINIDLSGFDGNIVFDSVFCAASSFLGSCDPEGSPAVPLTSAQSACLSTISENNPSTGVFQFSAPACTLTGSYTMALIFSDPGLTSLSSLNLSTIKVSTIPPAGAPEPGSLMLLGAGLAGIFLRRFSRREARS
jgi:hypothetical protein